MSQPVTIVICYATGTASVLRACLSSIARHTQDDDYRVWVVNRRQDAPFDAAEELTFLSCCELKMVDVKKTDTTSWTHADMLDAIVPRVETEFILTLDSDCFPVADGWLCDLKAMIRNGADCVGILYPYGPPPSDMPKNKIAYRVRSQQCWQTTHVACQMLSIDLLRRFQLKYHDGDDTGLAIPAAIKKAGLLIDGFRATRSPKPSGDYNAEFNRYVGIVFGDKVFHQGGFTRENLCGDEEILKQQFAWLKERVIAEEGAEFLLDDACSYRFKFDREEEVAERKMSHLFGLAKDRL